MPKLKCLDKFIKDNPELHQYLKDKSGVDFDGVYGKDAYVAAIKELQDNALGIIKDVYTQTGVAGYEKKAPTEQEQKLAANKKVSQLVPELGGEKEMEAEIKKEAAAAAIAPTDIHKAAKDAGIDFESKEFMDKSEELTGKRHLDDMSEAELGKVNDYVKEQARFAPQPKAEGVVPSLGNVESIEKALIDLGEDVFFDKIYNFSNYEYGSDISGVAEEYYAAKKDGSNPKLVKAVEDAIASNPSLQAKNKVEKSDSIFGDKLESKAHNYDNPLAEMNKDGANYRIAEGLIENKKKTYLLYKDGEVVGKFNSVDDAKKAVTKTAQPKAEGVVPSSLKGAKGNYDFSGAMEGLGGGIAVGMMDADIKNNGKSVINNVDQATPEQIDNIKKTFDAVKKLHPEKNLELTQEGNIITIQPQQQTSPIQGEKAAAAEKPKIRVGAEQVQAAQPQKTQPNEKAAESTTRQENKGAESSTRPTEKTSGESEEKLNERYKRVMADVDLVDPYDIAVKYFADGGRVNPSEMTRLFGGKGDKAVRISMIKNGAGTVKQIAHGMWEADQSGKYEDTDFIYALEEAMSDFSSKAAAQRNLVDRFDYEAAQEKFREQYGPQVVEQGVDIVEEMSEDDINKLLELDADETKAAELEDFVKQQAQKPKVRVTAEQVQGGQPSAAQPAQAAPAAETKAAPVTKKGEIPFPTALTVSEVKPYAEVEDNYYRPDQQLKFNQGTYEPVRIISHPDVIRAIGVGSRLINREKQQAVSDQDMKFAADVARKLGFVSDNGEGSAVALNQAVKEIAKQNRTNTHEVFVVLGEEGKGAAAAAVTPETKPEPPKFHGQVDTAINKLKDLLKPKTNLPPGTQIQGFSLDEILDKAGSIIKTAYDIGANIAEAIEDAIKFVKDQFAQNNLGEVDEDVLRQHFNEQFPQQTKKAQSTKQINEGMINQLGRNSEDALLDGVLHRRAVAADVAVEDTAKEDKLTLALMQEDADKLVQTFKDIYKEKYLTKVLSIIANVNKNNVSIDKILGIGIALENEIHNIKDGFTENNFGISRSEMNKVFAKVQKLNVENARTSSRALNVAKTLYNNYYENSDAKNNILSPDQSAQKDAITGAVIDEQAIDEAAEAHETGVTLTEEAKEQAAAKDTRTPKKVTEKSKVKAKLGDILKDLKDQLNKLDC